MVDHARIASNAESMSLRHDRAMVACEVPETVFIPRIEVMVSPVEWLW
jgi:hypothetical protein